MRCRRRMAVYGYGREEREDSCAGCQRSLSGETRQAIGLFRCEVCREVC